MEYLGNCETNPFDTVEDLIEIIDNAISISKEEFIGAVKPSLEFTLYGEQLNESIEKFPHDFEYFKSEWLHKDVFFFTHSRIEYFFRRDTNE